MFSDLKIKDEEKYANSLEEITTKREALDYIAANAGEYKSGKEDRLFEVLCSVLSDDADAKKCLKLIKKEHFIREDSLISAGKMPESYTKIRKT